MFEYTWIQWLFFFFFYCFFGWCFESTVVSVQKRRFVNRGFIRGPLLPLYGTGAIMMLVVSKPFQDNLWLTYLAGCVAATVLEYVTGVAMEALFKVRYWDYSKQKFNFQGQICLSSTLAWGGLTILMTRVVHKPVERFAFWLPDWLLTLITMTVLILFVADFSISFRTALDLRNVLVKMEKAGQELERMYRRLDVILALLDEAAENKKKEWADLRQERLAEHAFKREELYDSIEEAFGRIKERVQNSELLQEHREEWQERREELLELRARFKAQLEKRELSQFIEDLFKRDMLKGNPSMVSRKYSEALEELKKSAAAYRKKKKDEE